MADLKPFRKATNLDERWRPYFEQFKGTPVYYFESLSYPTSCRDAARLVIILSSDVENIATSLLLLEDEISRAPEEEKSELASKKDRAIRAQRMKQAQIRIIEAWQLDQRPSAEEEIRKLKLHVALLRKAMELALGKMSLTEEEFIRMSEYLRPISHVERDEH